ncbi:hypothetical protein [Bacillus pumilus]|uniref:hypothetical protein n=1 Tax=Bacillus pumilus TaxID=1408 RepID=UPI003D9A49E3
MRTETKLKGNFEEFAPSHIFEYLKAVALTRSNIIISGEIGTGTGKTEFRKLLRTKHKEG